MKILAIDTAMEACSVALWKNNIVYVHFERCFREHTKRILPMIKNILEQNSISLSELDVLACNCGPGSFTGTRVGMSVTQGLALGANLPVIGVSSFIIIAQGTWRNTGANKVLVAIDATMKEIFWAEYIRDQKGIWHGKKSESILKKEKINERLKKLSGQWTKAGTGWKNYSITNDTYTISLQDSNVLLSTAEDILPIAYQFLKEGEVLSVDEVKPIYLLNETAWKKLSK